MLRTKQRDKAGTTEYWARAYYVIPLDDPEAEGDQGLQGFDEDAEYGTFPTKAKALAWLRRTVKADRQWRQATIEQHDWTADEFFWDEEGDTVLDAIEEHTYTWGYWVEDHKLRVEDEWKP